MVDIYHAPKNSDFERDSKGFLHYLQVWETLPRGYSGGLSPEPSLIVAMDKKEYQKRLPQLLKLGDIEFEADIKVTFQRDDAEIIKNSLNGTLRKHYARETKVPLKNMLEFTEIDFDEKDNAVIFNPEGVSIKKLLNADMIRGKYDTTYIITIENRSDPADHMRRLENDHHFIASVADLQRPWSDKRYLVEQVSPKVEKIIEILTGEKQEATEF